MHVQNLGCSRLKLGAQNNLFSTFVNLTANVYGIKNAIDGRGTALKSTKGPPTTCHSVSKFYELWSTNGLKWVFIFTPSANFVFCFIARLRTRRLANGTQLNFVKRWDKLQ